jgi:hypothetical protein
MARPGRKRKNPEMMLTILCTAFLVYVRVLLFLQGLYLGFWAWLWWPRPDEHTQFWGPVGLALLFAFLSLSEIAAAILLRRGRRWAAVTAILVEALWTAAAAALGYWTLTEGALDLHLLFYLTVGGALFLVTTAGLLLRPVRAYAGLVRG